MGDRHIKPGSRATNFFGGSYDGFRVAQNFAHGIAAGHMPQSSVLDFASRADDGTLAVSLDNFGISAQRGDQRARHLKAQRPEVIHETGDLFDILSGKGIVDYSNRSGAAQRSGRNRPTLVEDFFHRREFLANLN